MSGPSAPDLGALMERAKEMQEKLGSLQRELAMRSVEGSAGGGLVRVTMMGDLRVQRVEIDPSLSGDHDMLQDLVAAAVNAAIGKRPAHGAGRNATRGRRDALRTGRLRRPGRMIVARAGARSRC